jgi:hypothetical protein
MENKIYKALELAETEFQSKLKEMLKTFPELADTHSHVRIELFEVPISSMPKGSVRRSDNKQKSWLAYCNDYFKPAMYSVSRKIKVVFEDEPETNIQS